MRKSRGRRHMHLPMMKGRHRLEEHGLVAVPGHDTKNANTDPQWMLRKSYKQSRPGRYTSTYLHHSLASSSPFRSTRPAHHSHVGCDSLRSTITIGRMCTIPSSAARTTCAPVKQDQSTVAYRTQVQHRLPKMQRHGTHIPFVILPEG